MMRKKMIIWLSLVLILVMATAMGCASQPQEKSGPFKGMEAPDFALKDMSGTEWTLSSLKGSSVALIFFTSW